YAMSLSVPAGTTLDLNGFHVFALDTQIAGTVVGGSISLAPSGSLTLNTPAPGIIGSDTEVDEWTFFGRKDQWIDTILSTGSARTPPRHQPYLNFGSIQLKDPNGNILASGTNPQSGANVLLLNQTLPLDGVYEVLVQTGKPGSQGHYVFTAWD